MASSNAEKLPLLATLGISAKQQPVSPDEEASSQPQSPRACALPTSFGVTLDETEFTTLSHEWFGCLLMFGAAVCFATIQMLSRLATDYQGFP